VLAKRFRFLAIVVSALVWSSAAPTADIDNGRNIAMRECAPCYIVAPFQRREVAEAPPFQVIEMKDEFDEGMIALSLLTPHSKMNFRLRQQDADDIAVYIASLGK